MRPDYEEGRLHYGRTAEDALAEADGGAEEAGAGSLGPEAEDWARPDLSLRARELGIGGVDIDRLRLNPLDALFTRPTWAGSVRHLLQELGPVSALTLGLGLGLGFGLLAGAARR